MLEKILIKEIISPIIVILLAILTYIIAHNIIKRLFASRAKRVDVKRQKTLMILVNNIVKWLIIILAFLIILDIFGIDTKGLIASVGVIGVVLGLAFQDLLKDFISGITIVLEGQYRVGDTVTIGGFKGEVIYLGLKTTKIKAYTGEIKIIANHLISDVINHTLEPSLAIVDVSVAYETNLPKLEKVLTELCERLSDELEDLKGKVELLGMSEMQASSIVYRITVPTVAMQQYSVQRRIMREVKLELDKNKITIPYNQLVIHNG